MFDALKWIMIACFVMAGVVWIWVDPPSGSSTELFCVITPAFIGISIFATVGTAGALGAAASSIGLPKKDKHNASMTTDEFNAQLRTQKILETREEERKQRVREEEARIKEQHKIDHPDVITQAEQVVYRKGLKMLREQREADHGHRRKPRSK